MTRTARAGLSTADTVFFLSDRPTMVGLLVFEDPGGIDQVAVEAWMTGRLDRSPILTHRVAAVPGFVDHPRWEPVRVDVARHVSVEEFTDTGWDRLGEKLVRMTANGLRRDVPPWKLSVFTGVTGVDGFPERAVVVALQLHHCVTDGLGFVHFLRAVCGTQMPPQWRLGSRVPWWMAAPARLPMLVTRLAVAGSRQWWDSVRHRSGPPAPPASSPRTPLNGRADGGRAHRFLTFTVPEVKATAKALGPYTINDVVVAMVAGAQRAYLLEKGELPASSLAAHVPLSIRGDGPPVGNLIAAMIVDMHTDLDDPRARLAAIAASGRRERERVSRLGPLRIAVLDGVPAPALRLFALKAGARPQAGTDVVPHPNTIVSNVPRGAADLEFLGLPVCTTVSVPEVIDGRGVGHVAASIGDVLTLAVSCDTGMMPDIDHYLDLVAKEYAALRALV
ncbi:wax ester/triacylglycerol synthase domain-containing protein [Rhodococcus sp. SGAir0479]|uniref:wax ester/triacylglycerol synthase domain-containing protein n=1 Tax=Rhodococcus sp. SGAir0479 TaxID=2567884 RepID=UPI0010CD0C6D|nr:wax ester/triacylglycerol synthase domain-containing protein [Rhodococcus sp. SGAir0479]QCQ91601.1 DUF1298 domain-containing protein [Rhodococcus sp. SGAir0479]